jgi:predicted small secreted protein
MKKISAIVSAVILIAGLFAACNGSDGGKVSDTAQDMGNAMTELATDISDMWNGDMTVETDTAIDNTTM